MHQRSAGAAVLVRWRSARRASRPRSRARAPFRGTGAPHHRHRRRRSRRPRPGAGTPPDGVRAARPASGRSHPPDLQDHAADLDGADRRRTASRDRTGNPTSPTGGGGTSRQRCAHPARHGCGFARRRRSEPADCLDVRRGGRRAGRHRRVRAHGVSRAAAGARNGNSPGSRRRRPARQGLIIGDGRSGGGRRRDWPS